MIKPLHKVVIEGTCLNIIKAIYDKPEQTFFSMVKTESISSKVRTRQGCPLLPLLFNIVLVVLAMAEKKKK